MSQEGDERQEMRPEYNISGGVRGKYLNRYRQGTSITAGLTFEESPFIAKSTASAPSVGTITRAVSYPPLHPSPKIQIGGPPAVAHAGQDPSR